MIYDHTEERHSTFSLNQYIWSVYNDLLFLTFSLNCPPSITLLISFYKSLFLCNHFSITTIRLSILDIMFAKSRLTQATNTSIENVKRMNEWMKTIVAIIFQTVNTATVDLKYYIAVSSLLLMAIQWMNEWMNEWMTFYFCLKSPIGNPSLTWLIDTNKHYNNSLW